MKRACLIGITIVLCLAVSISTLYFSATQNEMQAATGSFTLPGTPFPTPTPSPTPTPEPTPTPTATPTAAPTPTPTATSSGSSQPSISLQLIIDMIGHKTTGLQTSAGKVLGDITAVSTDGKLALTIYKDTFVFNMFGEPLTAINITVVDPLLKAPQFTPPPDHYFIQIYEFSPQGAGFSSPVEIEFTYDPSELPKSLGELTLQLYVLNGAPDEWEALPSLSDIETSSVICSTNHLSTYALIAAPLEVPAPTPQPTLAPTSPATNGYWILLVLILPAASLIFFIYVLLRWRRRNSTPEEPKL